LQVIEVINVVVGIKFVKVEFIRTEMEFKLAFQTNKIDDERSENFQHVSN
jgi:hypothetical protein